MPAYITDLDVSTNAADEQDLDGHSYKKINVNLNKGTKGNPIFLWYKKGSSKPITRVQLSYSNAMTEGLTEAGYTKIDKNLNAGAGGDDIYLWYFKGSGEFDAPIVDISVSTDAEDDARMFAEGREELACDLNRNDVDALPIHILVKRQQQTYICDVTATNAYSSDLNKYQEGYIRLDEDTNRGAAGGKDVYIWYRQTTDPDKALTDLQVSITDSQCKEYEKRGYKREPVNLNEGTKSGNKVYLWYRKQEGGEPIKAIMLLLQEDAVAAYQKADVTVIERNLNAGIKGHLEYICYNQKG